jgi:hypothetical protein
MRSTGGVRLPIEAVLDADPAELVSVAETEKKSRLTSAAFENNALWSARMRDSMTEVSPVKGAFIAGLNACARLTMSWQVVAIYDAVSNVNER